MKKLVAKDLIMMGAVVANAHDFLLGRAEGRVIMDVETTAKLEEICMGISILGDSFIAAEVFTHAHMIEAAHDKMELAECGEHIEDHVFKALRECHPRIIKKIKAGNKMAEEFPLEECIEGLRKEMEA